MSNSSLSKDAELAQLRSELEQTKAERAQQEKESAKSREEIQQITKEMNQIRRNEAVTAAFARSSVRFRLPNNEVMRLVEGDVALGEGNALTVAGKPFKTALEELATRYPYLVDGRTTKSLRSAPEEQTRKLTKGDLKDAKAKSAYISQHGLAAFEALILGR
jgi:hypothetical protein